MLPHQLVDRLAEQSLDASVVVERKLPEGAAHGGREGTPPLPSSPPGPGASSQQAPEGGSGLLGVPAERVEAASIQQSGWS